MSGPAVALVHDYLTQRGGAERVVASMLRAFPGAPVHTSLFLPEGTLPAFGHADVRTLPLNRVRAFRENHRLAFPLLAPAFSLHGVDADVVVCSTSGWAHGVRVAGRKIVYCHTPARWLYQRDRYLGERRALDSARAALAALRPALVRWDRRAARSADRYLVNSHAVATRVRELYGVEAEVLPPPQTVDPEGAQEAVAGLEPGFLLCVSRLLPYKNVDAVVEAVAELRDERLVVVGSGPDEARLHSSASGHTTFVRAVSDEQLRWLYASCAGLLSASYEDYGLTPVEAAAFGKPAAVLGWGGFLDTVLDGKTGVFFDRPKPPAIRDAIATLRASSWDEQAIRRHAERYSEDRFIERLRQIVEEEGRAVQWRPTPIAAGEAGR